MSNDGPIYRSLEELQSRRPPVQTGGGFKLTVIVLCGLVLFLLGMTIRGWILGAGTAEPRKITARGDLADDEKTTISIFEEAAPSVVYITTARFERSRFLFNPVEVPRGSGSGFIWDNQGHIVTNHHVIHDADAWEVTLEDQSVWPARRIGVEPDKDLAVLKIDAPPEKLKALKIGVSGDLRVGQKAFAIGNPFGFDHTLTTGVVSGLGREIESMTGRPIQGVIQTDCAINPGNSGGPLLDSEGRLIGINTQIVSPSGASAGIGFAVPVDVVNQLVPDLINFGESNHPTLQIGTADDWLARRLGVRSGVVIIDVWVGGSAEKAGVVAAYRDRRGRVVLGDIIRRIDGKDINDSKDYYRALDNREEGEVVKLTTQRGRQIKEFEVTLRRKRSG